MNRDRDAQRKGAPADIGDLAVERDHGGRCQEISGDQPGQVMGIVEVAPDDRQRARQDGLIERAHEDRQQHAEHDELRLPVGEPLGLGRVGDGVHGRSGASGRSEAGGACTPCRAGHHDGPAALPYAGPAAGACCIAPCCVAPRCVARDGACRGPKPTAGNIRELGQVDRTVGAASPADPYFASSASVLRSCRSSSRMAS